MSDEDDLHSYGVGSLKSQIKFGSNEKLSLKVQACYRGGTNPGL